MWLFAKTAARQFQYISLNPGLLQTARKERQMKSNRQCPRVPLRILIHLFDGYTGQPVGHLEDISESGLRIRCKSIETAQPLSIGMILPCELFNSYTLTVDVHPIWLKRRDDHFLMGMRFRQLQTQQLSIIQELMLRYGHHEPATTGPLAQAEYLITTP